MMKYTEKQEEKIFIIDDTITSAGSRPETGKWKILIIDDDVEIHKITRLVLSGFTFNEKSLEFFSAYSEKEARLLIDQNPDAALIFLDVVMEQDDSGLRLIEYIRNIKINPFVRIVLRTGQPGQAPEEKVIHDYDINDYKEKTELTARKLYTTTISALRAYLDLKRIDDNRKGLERIVKSSENILNYKSVTEFISNALIQLIPILGPNKASPGEFSCFALSLEDSGSNIIAATGRYTGFIGLAAGAALGENITAELSGTRKNIFHEDHIILYIESKYGAAKLIYIEGKYELDVFDRELVEAYVTNLAIVCDNIYLTIENEETQREIIFGLGELSEARSEETGRHVKRVAEYCRLLANLYGLDEEMRDDIYIASTMHDVGKLVIPDMIINKPGRLTPEEFEIIRQHA
ncbi:MAG: DUF3369 domain-containing protein, partial [Clostridiales bacterium]|nr:DUF3369 domain-containing protein [Clostridiales bacterium]